MKNQQLFLIFISGLTLNRSIISNSSFLVMGLVIWESQPAANDFTLSIGRILAVRARIEILEQP